MKKRTIQCILGIIGVIFLGAIGSGLWQIGLEPVGNWLMDAIFKITTLGLSSLSDAFYREVAKGLHEDSSLLASYLLVLGFFWYFGDLWINMATNDIEKTVKKEHENIIAKIEENKDLSPDEKKLQIEEAMDELGKKYQRAHKKSCIHLKIILIFFATLITFQFLTVLQQNHIITDFRRRFSIGKIFLNEQEEEKILSKFSMITSKQDYLNVNNMFIELVNKKVEDLTSSSVKDKTEQ